jgi:hypothetical protein
MIYYFRGNNMNKDFTYKDAVNWVDVVECNYLQQGHRDDRSCFDSFEELMVELKEIRK